MKVFLWIWVSLVELTSMVIGNPTPDSYYTDIAARRLVHFDSNSGDCKLFGDRRIVEEILRELADSESPVAIVEAAELTAIISECSKRNPQDHRAPPAKDFPHIIYPGTKWCGTGNAAENVDDLGSLRDLDICYRNHDLCPDDLDPGESNHNITNDSPFAISHCLCNQKFRSCLKKLGTGEAREVGNAYFSTGLFQCYDYVKPVTGCVEWAGLLTQACQEYSFDESQEPRWQILDMKSFD